MTDRVYPSAKPPAAANGGNPAFPATKAQLYNASRPAYRPQPPRRSRRSCCCACCLWTTFAVAILLLLAAVTGAVLWVLYRPHRPNFTVSSLKISQFNLTSSNQLNSKFNLTVVARNPNKKLVFFYDAIAVSVYADGVDAGHGSFPAFTHGTKNTTVLRWTITSSAQDVDGTSLKSDLKKKKSLPLKIRMDSKVRVKVGGVKTGKFRVRVSCGGIRAAMPTGKTPTTVVTSDAKCKFDLRFKIWKWTL